MTTPKSQVTSDLKVTHECCVCYEKITDSENCNLTCSHNLCLVCCKQMYSLSCPMCRRKEVFGNTNLTWREVKVIKKRRINSAGETTSGSVDIILNQTSSTTSSTSFEEEFGQRDYDRALEEYFFNENTPRDVVHMENLLRDNLSDSGTLSFSLSSSADEQSIDYPEEESAKNIEIDEDIYNNDEKDFLQNYDFFEEF